MKFIKSKFRKKTLAAVLGIGICLTLSTAAHANRISYQGTEARFQDSYDRFSSLPVDGIDLSRDFFIRLDWAGSLGRTEKEHINLYHTPVTYANKTGYVFKAGKLYAMTSAYRFGYTGNANYVLDLGSAQAILGGYFDLTDGQLEQIQALIVNQTVENSFEITDNFAVNDTSDTFDAEGDVFTSSNDQNVENDLLANVDSFISSSESVVRELAISSDSFINSIEAIDQDLLVEDKAVTENKSQVKVKGSKRISADGEEDSGDPIKKPTMRERIAKILQESYYPARVDSEEGTITNSEKQDDDKNDIAEVQGDVIEEARRVRYMLEKTFGLER